MKTALIISAIISTAFVASAQKPYSAPRTPWGHPDLQGTWTTDDARSVPLQRAVEFGDRRLLTDQEYADRKRRDDEEKVIEEYVKKGLPPPPLARPNDGEILPADPSFGRRR
jgi:hypothetical protein